MRRRIDLERTVKMRAEKWNCDGKWFLRYYLVIPGEKDIFVFQRKYTERTFKLCRNGIEVSRLVRIKERDKGIMLLVSNTKRMLPFLYEMYQLPLIA